MKKKYLKLSILLIAMVCLAWGFLVVWQEYSYKSKFVDNQKGEPYSCNIPLDEMDFDVYAEYFNQAGVLIDHNYTKGIELPCDVEYYNDPQDAEPALTLKKGTLVYVLPYNVDSFPVIGYGLQCWPDYQSGWRYGHPFLAGAVSYSPEDYVMYYVKSGQLEEVAKAFYRVNSKQLGAYRSASKFAAAATDYIDKKLYDNGVFCAP